MHDHDDNVISLFGGLGHDANEAAAREDRRTIQRLELSNCVQRKIIENLQERAQRQQAHAIGLVLVAFQLGFIFRALLP